MMTGTTPIENVSRLLDDAFAALHDKGCRGAADVLKGLDAHAQVLESPRYASHVKHLANLRESLEHDDFLSARRNLLRVKDTLSPSSNDKPFSRGDVVSVIRERHGWHDGDLIGTVRSRSQSAEGTWSYEVEDGDGETYEVARTRDLSAAWGQSPTVRGSRGPGS